MAIRTRRGSALLLLALCAPACATIRDWFSGPELRGESREVEFETIPERGNVYVFTTQQWAQLGGESIPTNLASMQRWYRGQAPLKLMLPDWRHVAVAELDGRTVVTSFTPGEKPAEAKRQVISFDLRPPNATAAPAPATSTSTR